MKCKKIIIYDIDFLLKGEYSDDDLFLLFESKSLTYSLASAQFDIINCHKSKKEIISILNNVKSWPDKYFFNIRQYNRFIKLLSTVFKNLYQYNNESCLRLAQHWMIYYGFRIH